MKDIAMLNKAPLDFFGCNFCLVEKHRMAFCPYFEMWTHFFGEYSYLCVYRYDS